MPERNRRKSSARHTEPQSHQIEVPAATPAPNLTASTHTTHDTQVRKRKSFTKRKKRKSSIGTILASKSHLIGPHDELPAKSTSRLLLSPERSDYSNTAMDLFPLPAILAEREPSSSEESILTGHIQFRYHKLQHLYQVGKKRPVNKNKDPRITKEHSYNLIEAFKFLHWLGKWTGRSPLFLGIKSTGAFRFFQKPCSWRPIMFVLVTVILTLILFLAFVNVGSILLNIPQQWDTGVPGVGLNETEVKWRGQLRAEELYLFHRNVAGAALIVLELIQAVAAGWTFFARRDLASNYFTLWSGAVEVLNIDASYEVKEQIYALLGGHALIWCLLLVCCLTTYIPFASGLPSVFVVILTRVFYPHIYTCEYLWLPRILAIPLFGYIIICAKLFAFMYYAHCRFISGLFSQWNHRCRRGLRVDIHGRKKKVEIPAPDPAIFDALFKEHVILLDLVLGADELYGDYILVFFGTETVSLSLVLYYLTAILVNEEFSSTYRRMDGIAILLYIIQILYMMYIIAIAASHVYEEASDGMEVIRCKGLLGSTESREMHFIMSMYVSFTGYTDIGLTAGNFFMVNKGLVLGIVVVIFSYFIVLIQLAPTLSYNGYKYQTCLTREIKNTILEIFELTPELLTHDTEVRYWIPLLPTCPES